MSAVYKQDMTLWAEAIFKWFGVLWLLKPVFSVLNANMLFS